MSPLKPLLTFAAFSFAAGPLAGQEPARPQPAAERQRIISVGPEGRRIYEVFNTRRGRLGISVNMQAQPTDSVGAMVETVTPGGPAARAGLRSGDVITSLNGKALVGVAGRSTARQLPGIVLVELLARQQAGDSVVVAYRRGNLRRSTTVVLEEMPESALAPFASGTWSGAMDFPPTADWPGRMPLEGGVPLNVGPGDSFILFRSRMADLELAPMNPDLGQYFGVGEGVLVISAPPDSPLKLRGGDVVLMVDGRRVTGPSHLFRILGSYESGEVFRIDLMRQKRREAVRSSVD